MKPFSLSLESVFHFNQAFDGATSLRRSTPYPPSSFPDYFSVLSFLSILLSPSFSLFLTFPHTSFSLFELTGPISCVVDCGNLEAPFTIYLLFVLKSVVFVSTFFSLASFFLPFLTFDCVSSFFFFVSFLLVVLYLVLFVSFLC